MKETETCTIYSLGEFLDACLSGWLMDYDGSGYYVNRDGEQTTKRAIPTDFRHGKLDTDFSCVNWYNR